MEQLVNALRKQVDGVTIRTGVSGLRLNPSSRGSYLLKGKGFEGVQDRVILSTPAPAASRLLAGLASEEDSPLSRVPYTSTRIIYLAYRRSEFSHPLNGFGFVAAEGADTVLDACTWVSSKFDDRCPPDSVLLRCAVHDGRRRREPMSEDESVTRVHQELRRILGISCTPTLHYVWDHGPGHAPTSGGSFHQDRENPCRPAPISGDLPDRGLRRRRRNSRLHRDQQKSRGGGCGRGS